MKGRNLQGCEKVLFLHSYYQLYIGIGSSTDVVGVVCETAVLITVRTVLCAAVGGLT